MAKKYYWLRLKDDWFGSKTVKKLRRIAGGDTYVIIYLKMQLLSLKSEGKLFYEGIEETLAEELALELDEDPENVRVTLSYLQNCGLMEAASADEYMLTEVPSLIGGESESAERVRKSRNNKNKKLVEEKALHCNADVTECNALVTECNADVTERRDREDIEIDKREENREKREDTCAERAPAPEPEPIMTLPLNTGEEYPIFESDIREFAELYPAVDVMQAMRGMRGWCMTNPARRKTKRGIRRFINSWLAREQDKGGRTGTLNLTQNQSRQNSSTVEQFAQMAREWADE
ncbi:MAG: phage replisome organizer N-terminal domain-containing protein [Akkermansia sp.]|nr:phage replisome organizer N-terminal domain-containing protein [Akkermansia sp.]